MGHRSFILLYLITTQIGEKKAKVSWLFLGSDLPLKKDLRQGSPLLWASIPIPTGPKYLLHNFKAFSASVHLSSVVTSNTVVKV